MVSDSYGFGIEYATNRVNFKGRNDKMKNTIKERIIGQIKAEYDPIMPKVLPTIERSITSMFKLACDQPNKIHYWSNHYIVNDLKEAHLGLSVADMFRILFHPQIKKSIQKIAKKEKVKLIKKTNFELIVHIGEKGNVPSFDHPI